MITPQEQEWLGLVYEQAWGQYTHEDQMSEQRDTKYLTILSLFLTAAGVLCTMALSYIFAPDPESRFNKVYAVGLMAVILMVAGLVLCFLKHWNAVTKTGKDFIEKRLTTIRKIETKIKASVTLAEEESAQTSQKDGFAYTLAIIRLLTIVSIILMALAVLGAAGVLIFL